MSDDDLDSFEYTLLNLGNTLAQTLRYLMASRPLEDDEDPPGEEKPEDVKPDKVVAIGGKKQ